ncbi:MAG TPA: cytochrome P450 [Jatrophihabitantaceae bacterium]|jgi:cytochrome P450 family 142 subfamily A polypeptide 1|nr:cytochrome P450 [Jatrophihabitantaceae bacterium]
MTQAPGELGIDLMSGGFFAADPYPAFAWMRANAPVYYDEANDLWALAAYRDVKAAGADPATFSNAGGARPKYPPLPMMIDFDAPEHHRRRRLVSAGFTPRRVAALEEHVRRICDDVIDEVCEQGSCDFVRDIAAPLPLNMIGDLLGVAREDRADLLRWSEDMLRSQGDPDPEAMNAAMTAFVEYTTYMGPVLDDRRRSGAEDDLVGILVQAEIDGDRLDQDSLITETLLILIGGDETTRHVISGGMLALQEHPDQLARLRSHPSGLGTAVEEMLRWVTPIKNMARLTTRQVEVSGTEIPEDVEVLLLYPSANRDETVFNAPDAFDVARDPNPHLAFGFGSHFCLGNQLARIELRVMFEQLLARLPDLALAEPGPFTLRPSNFISGVEAMPMTFTPGRRVRPV